MLTSLVLPLFIFLLFSLVFLLLWQSYLWLAPSLSLRQALQDGNVSIALAQSGKMMASALIVHQAIIRNDTIGQMLGWTAIGITFLLISSILMEKAMLRFSINKALNNDNRAVGLIVLFLFLSFGWIISAVMI
ncbi:DUF350 domain-containing protein [Heliophilum fasciatum]|uniref:Putative membrane protein n=1 Tax=Heliophilum fasciatum TaxID=35700 RepID=A0A4R2REW3_9FIRM|nr:DUF350 domain-containing protein [Heliophilum fasciatum]MCW2278939.1 putative membrane protein [Heliophilum fasciatum]TCP62072.1 putative membrane protein [Heliophilum fasciatum]